MADQVKKDKKSQKKGFFARAFAGIKKFFKDYKNELKNITWCSGKQLVNNTWVVLVCIVAVAVVVGALDFGFSKLLTVIAESVSIS